MWDGNQWSNIVFVSSSQNLFLGGVPTYETSYVLMVHNNQLFVGGYFQYIFTYGNGDLSGIAMWDGQNWYGLSSNYLPSIGSVKVITVYQLQLLVSV